MAGNTYSPAWFDTFLVGYPSAHTEAEVAFLARQLPLPDYRRVLDLCCGMGRHALPLAELGHEVTGVDINDHALAEAQSMAGDKVTFLRGDMRDLSSVPGRFDAVLNLWQSFGNFDAATNADVLRQIHDKLRPEGRFILDIYHRGFIEARQGERTFEKDSRVITESKRMSGDRLTVTLDYGPTTPLDMFDWQVFTPDEICLLGEEVGFRPLVVCTWCDETRPATPDEARMQLVFEKVSK